MSDRPAIDDVRWQRYVDLLDMHRTLERSDPEGATLVWLAAFRLLTRIVGEDERRGRRESVPPLSTIRSYEVLARVGYFDER